LSLVDLNLGGTSLEAQNIHLCISLLPTRNLPEALQ
jgi:hypothetical protein